MPRGSLKAAVRDNDPVLVLGAQVPLQKIKGSVPEDDYIVPIGKGDIKREG